jgi:hypothetical protein
MDELLSFDGITPSISPSALKLFQGSAASSSLGTPLWRSQGARGRFSSHPGNDSYASTNYTGSNSSSPGTLTIGNEI